MKFSTFASTIVGAAFLFAYKAAAHSDLFGSSYQRNQYTTGNCIRFIVDDVADSDDRVYADLYTENGRFVKTIRRWGDDFDEEDDDSFIFTWCIDNTIPTGRYFVAVVSEEDDDDDGRSFTFAVTNPNTRTPEAYPNTGNFLGRGDSINKGNFNFGSYPNPNIYSPTGRYPLSRNYQSTGGYVSTGGYPSPSSSSVRATLNSNRLLAGNAGYFTQEK